MQPSSSRYPLELAVLEAIATHRFLVAPQVRCALYLQGHRIKERYTAKLLQALWENEMLAHPVSQIALQTYKGLKNRIYALDRAGMRLLASKGFDVSHLPKRPDKANSVKDDEAGHHLMGNQYDLTLKLALHHQPKLTLDFLVPEQNQNGTTGITWKETFQIGRRERTFTFRVHPDFWQSLSYKQSNLLCAIEIDNNTERGESIDHKIRSLDRLMELARQAKANRMRPKQGLMRHEIPAPVQAFLEQWDLIDQPWSALFVTPTVRRCDSLMAKVAALKHSTRITPPIFHTKRFLFLSETAYSSVYPQRSRVRQVSQSGTVQWPPSTFHGYDRILGHQLRRVGVERPKSFKTLLTAKQRARHRQHTPQWSPKVQQPML